MTRKKITERLTNFGLRRSFGALCLALATAGILFFAYEQLWTNHVADKAAQSTAQQIKNEWQTPSSQKVPRIGQGFALLYIPALREDVWELPILHGTEPEQLDVGAGHYVNTRLPGAVGNFALAGHRSTHGEPFANFDRLRAGDRVIVQTRDNWFIYELDFDAQVSPDDAWVLDVNPGGMANKVGTDKLITLTTCTPRYGSSGRWIWWGHLVTSASIKDVPRDIQ